MATRHQRVVDADAELAGEVVVAGAGEAQFRADPRRQAAPAAFHIRQHHQPFKGLCDLRPGETIIAMAPLHGDRQQATLHQLGEMAARRLRRDARDPGELLRRQRAPVHQRVQHVGAGRIAHQMGDLGEIRA